MFSPSTTPFMPSERLATKCTFEVTQNMNAYDARVYGVEAAYQRDFGFITPALRCLGFYGNYTYTHSTLPLATTIRVLVLRMVTM